jgi:hypothetical protein
MTQKDKKYGYRFKVDEIKGTQVKNPLGSCICLYYIYKSSMNFHEEALVALSIWLGLLFLP